MAKEYHNCGHEEWGWGKDKAPDGTLVPACKGCGWLDLSDPKLDLSKLPKYEDNAGD